MSFLDTFITSYNYCRRAEGPAAWLRGKLFYYKMTFRKLKTVLYSLAIFSLFFGGLYGFCSLVNQDAHNNNTTYTQESGVAPTISEIASYCCAIQAHNSNTLKQLTGSIIQNRNLSGPDTFLPGLALLIFFSGFFDKSKKIVITKFYYLRQLVPILHNHLLLAFSRGILHPKIYSF